MFTGLVEGMGTVRESTADAAGLTLHLIAPAVTDDLPIGASIAVNGVCLTVTQRHADGFTVQAGPETLRLTNLGKLCKGQAVNLERALRLGDRLGGHLVQGHVDGVGTLHNRERQGEWEFLRFTCPPELTRAMIRKGSIAVEGVSLTLNDVGNDFFTVALIPHTLQATTLGQHEIGSLVNLETDFFGKYLQKYLEGLPLPAPSVPANP